MTALRILVADVHEIVRRGLCAILESHTGWEVCGEAADGREAVEKTRQLNPDVVILDIGMPSLNGLEATRQILRGNPLQRVLILTVTDAEQLIEEVLTAREREVVQLLVEGKSTKEVAVMLNLSVKTAETHRSNIMRKLGLHCLSELVLYAVRNGIIQIAKPILEEPSAEQLEIAGQAPTPSPTLPSN